MGFAGSISYHASVPSLGSAAAVASGEVWLAHGSDLGGSLRTPASFNGIIGLRPSPGRVPHGPLRQPFDTLSVDGPMGRTPEDVALFLDALSGVHPHDPLSLELPARSFLSVVRERRAPRAVAFSPDLGIVPIDPDVLRICEAAAGRFTELGARVINETPDFSLAIDAFQVLRAAYFVAEHAEHLQAHRELLKPEIIWNIEKGLALNAGEIGQAEVARAQVVGALSRLFDTCDLLLCPTAIVPPFAVESRYVEEVNGQRFDNYIHWIAITFDISLTGCPAVSVPAGLTDDGLPVGLQIIGPPRSEAMVLSAAACFDDLSGFSRQLPIDPQMAGLANP